MVCGGRFKTCRQNVVCIENITFGNLSAENPWHLPTQLNSCLFSETKRLLYSSLHQNRGIETEITFYVERTNRTILLKSYIALNLSSNNTVTRTRGLFCVTFREHSDTSRSLFLRVRNVSEKFCGENQIHILCSVTLFLRKSCYI